MKFKKISLPKFDLEAIFTLLFYTLALFTILFFFIWREKCPQLFITTGFIAIFVRLLGYFILWRKKKKAQEKEIL